MTPSRRAIAPADALGWCIVAAVVAWVSCIRVGLIHTGPDRDFDAATHALIGRLMITQWRDIHIHWVWLPFWHVVNAVVARAGGGLDTVRCFSVACAAISPFLLAATLRVRARSAGAGAPAWLQRAESVIPFAAATMLALWPDAIEMGESAEPEAFFVCVVLGACLLWELELAVGAGVLLAFAAATRYEAWALVPVFFALWALGPRSRAGATVWLAPSLVIAAWIAAHAILAHEAFEFLRVNRAYVHNAWADLHFNSLRSPGVLHPWRWYPQIVPQRSLGDSLWLCVPGGVWMLWRGPRSLTSAGAMLLGFITLVWVRRMNLGLPRHFAVVVPCYATAAVAAVCVGTAAVNALIASRVPKLAPWLPIAIWLAAALMEMRIVHWRTLPDVHALEAIQQQAWLSERRAAAVVRANLTEQSRVFCDQTEVEIYTEMPVQRFIRWNAVGIAPYNFFVEAVQHGHALVVSVPERVSGLRATSQTLYDDGHLVVLRRDTPPDITPALRALILTRPMAH